MSYPSKTYKVQPLFRMLYDCCIDVVNEDKSPMTKGLLIKEIGLEKSLTLNQYEFNGLIEKMIYDLKKKIYASSYKDAMLHIRTQERYLSIMKIFNEQSEPSTVGTLSFRIHDTLIEDIHKLKTNTLGEVIELAVALFITTCDDTVFNLICLAFRHYKY